MPFWFNKSLSQYLLLMPSFGQLPVSGTPLHSYILRSRFQVHGCTSHRNLLSYGCNRSNHANLSHTSCSTYYRTNTVHTTPGRYTPLYFMKHSAVHPLPIIFASLCCHRLRFGTACTLSTRIPSVCVRQCLHCASRLLSGMSLYAPVGGARSHHE